MLQVDDHQVQIVGVARDAKYDEPTEDPRPFLYLSLAQQSSVDRETIIVRSSVTSMMTGLVLRDQIHGLDAALPVFDVRSFDDVLRDRSLYSSVASCSSGVELDRAQVVVVGNATGVGGRYRIGHAVMNDALDADGIWDAIRSAGLALPERPHSSDLDGRLVNVFLKCEASQDGEVRGRRNAMLDDSDVHWHRQIKACVGGVTAAVTGDPAVFVSVSAAHQGPDGGGPVAAIVDLG